MAPADVPIAEVIAGLGLAGRDAGRARAALEHAGLTNPRKTNLSSGKVAAAGAVLTARFQRLCAACAPAAPADGRTRALVDSAFCERCGGSNNGRAVRDMVAACRAGGVARLLVVGGSPSFRQELERLVAGGLGLRLVDGTLARKRTAAQADIAWADVVVVLGGTELAHKVSELYTRDAAGRAKLVQTRRRGIEAVADEVARSDVVARGARRAS